MFGMKIWNLLFYLILKFNHSLTERGGITQCTDGATVPSGTLDGTGSSNSGTSAQGVLMQDGAFMFTCCGVVKSLNYHAGSGGDIDAQVWRQTGANEFTVISKSTLTLSAGSPGSVTADLNARLSFQEGDLIGWYGASGVLAKTKMDTTKKLSRLSNSVGTKTVGQTFDWNGVDASVNVLFLMQYVVTPSTAPFFRNLPTTLSYLETQTTIGGLSLLTLTVTDLDQADISGLFVQMGIAWDDYFNLDNNTLEVTTTRKLEPGLYTPVFRVEESHCGVAATSTLTVTVLQTALSITNLPAYATVHEDTRDETLLHTVTTSDPTNQGIWCKGDWTIGTANANTPFIVKMISTTSGDSRAGIYLIEEPGLDYDTHAQFYSLSVICTDTDGNTDTESFYVNIVKNQVPILTNLGHMVEVDATTVKTGTTIFTVTTTDVENDQVTFTSTCTPSADCPFTLFASGHVMIKSNLLLWDTTTYTIDVTPVDLRDSGTQRQLIIYIRNANAAPAFGNLNAGVNVTENSALATSLFQVSATDTDTADTLTYYMTMAADSGWALMELSSSGEVTTHSTFNIDFDVLATATHEMIVYVHDGKEAVSATLTLTVHNVNEAPIFTQTTYGLSHAEGVVNTQLNTGNIAASDPDAGDTVTITMNCSTYNSYFTINPTTGRISYAQDYDLDTGILPTEVTCSLTATDTGNLTDTSEVYILITYTNDHTPAFNPASYSATVSSITPLGYSVLTVTATDGDQNDDGIFSYSIDQSSLGGTYFAITNDGRLYTTTLLTATAAFGTRTITARATDSGGLAGTASIVITFLDASTDLTTTTDRNWKFREDSRNVYWLTIAVITVVACLFVIILIIVRYCMARTKPLCKDWWTRPKKRKLDKNRRPKPFGRQQRPTYRHLHAREVLRPSPPPVMTPDLVESPDDQYSNRANSATSLISGRANLSQVDLKESKKSKKKKSSKNEDIPQQRGSIIDQPSSRNREDDINSWLNDPVIQNQSAAPERAVTHARGADRDYMRHRKSKRRGSDSPIPPSPSVSLPEMASIGLQPSVNTPVTVSPSPLSWDNSGEHYNDGYEWERDESDFRSERPGSQESETNV